VQDKVGRGASTSQDREGDRSGSSDVGKRTFVEQLEGATPAQATSSTAASGTPASQAHTMSSPAEPLAWTAKGKDEQLGAASREFLRMLVSIAMTALAYTGAKGNVGKAVKIAQAMPPAGLVPALVGAGGRAGPMVVAGEGVKLGVPSPAGPLGTVGAMMTKHGDGESAEPAGAEKPARKTDEPATPVTTGAVDKFSPAERGVIHEAQGVVKSAAFEQIRAAHRAGKSVTVEINGVTIQYEPDLPASGMTMFGEEGFLIGPEAFANPSELTKTVLHELHRLRTTASADGVSAGLASQETKAAFDFAERAAKEIQ
jgi:hypothetical protein